MTTTDDPVTLIKRRTFVVQTSRVRSSGTDDLLTEGTTTVTELRRVSVLKLEVEIE